MRDSPVNRLKHRHFIALPHIRQDLAWNSHFPIFIDCHCKHITIIAINSQIDLLWRELGPLDALASLIHPEVAELAPSEHPLLSIVESGAVIGSRLNPGYLRLLLSRFTSRLDHKFRKLHFFNHILSHLDFRMPELTFKPLAERKHLPHRVHQERVIVSSFNLRKIKQLLRKLILEMRISILSHHCFVLFPFFFVMEYKPIATDLSRHTHTFNLLKPPLMLVQLSSFGAPLAAILVPQNSLIVHGFFL